MKDKDKVYIKIKGVDSDFEMMNGFEKENEQEEEIEVIYVGTYHIVNGNEYVKYDEVIDEKITLKNIMKLTIDCVDLIKKAQGMSSTHITLERGRKTNCCYDTGYGVLNLAFITNKLIINRSEDEIEVKVSYQIEFQGAVVSDRILEMIVTTKNITLQ